MVWARSLQRQRPRRFGVYGYSIGRCNPPSNPAVAVVIIARVYCAMKGNFTTEARRTRRKVRLESCDMKKDRTFTLLAVAAVLLVVSYLVPATSVHTYCESRFSASVVAICDAVVLYFLFRNVATSRLKKVFSAMSVVSCLLGCALDVTFIIWATKECQELMNNLNRISPVR
jgi:cbb3-type cytochrome oxidase subunit 1